MDLHLLKRELGFHVISQKRQRENAPVSWSNLTDFIPCDRDLFYESAQALLEDVMKSAV